MKFSYDTFISEANDFVTREQYISLKFLISSYSLNDITINVTNHVLEYAASGLEPTYIKNIYVVFNNSDISITILPNGAIFYDSILEFLNREKISKDVLIKLFEKCKSEKVLEGENRNA